MSTANNYSLDFEASNSDYVSIAHASQTGLGFTGSFSAMIWLNPESTPISGGGGNRATFISKYDDAVGGYEIGYLGLAGSVNSINVLLRQDASTEDSISFSGSTYNIAAGNFINYCITVDYSGGTPEVKLYANKNLIATDTSGSTTAIGVNTAEFAIGARSGGSNFVDGMIDEVKVWDAVLTQELIGEYLRENITQSATQGQWSFDNNLFDASSNANHLSVAGGAPVYSATVGFLNYGRTQRYLVGAGDGEVNSADGSWDTARNADVADSADPTATQGRAEVKRTNFPTVYTIRRFFMPVDTSGQDPVATIYDAYAGIYIGSGSDDFDRGIQFVQTTQASNTTLVTDDFDECGSVDNPETGSAVYTDLANPGLYRLNSTGVGWINTSGYTNLGIRVTADIDDQAPGSAGLDSVTIATSEYTDDTQYRPYLDIVDSFTPQDIESAATAPVGGSGGVDRDEGGEGSPGYTPGGSGSANGGSSAGESGLFFAAWLDT